MSRRNIIGLLHQFFLRPALAFEFAAIGALISAAIIILIAVGSAKLLAHEGSEALPVVYVLLAVVSIPLASLISAVLGRWQTSPICRVMCAVSVLLGLGLRAAIETSLPGIPQAICITAYVLEIVFDTLFWLSVSEYFPTRELKRHTPFLTAAFGMGGVVGGLLATILCDIFPLEELLFLNSFLFLLCFLQYGRINRRYKPLGDEEDDEQEVGLMETLRSNFQAFRAFPITGTISAGIFMMSALFCLQDYLAMVIFQETYADENTLARFIAMAFAGYQVLELLMVVVVGGLVLERTGPVIRNLIFPVTTLVSLSALALGWNLFFAVLVHVNANAISNAIFEPVKTLNYAAVPFRVLAPVRMMVEGIVYPIGIAASGLGLLWLQSMLEPRSILLVAIGLAVLFVFVSTVVGTSFLPSLISSLRLRAILPADYLQCGRERWFSRADIRQLLSHGSPEARNFGRDLALALTPDLLETGGVSAYESGNRRPEVLGLWHRVRHPLIGPVSRSDPPISWDREGTGENQTSRSCYPDLVASVSSSTGAAPRTGASISTGTAFPFDTAADRGPGVLSGPFKAVTRLQWLHSPGWISKYSFLLSRGHRRQIARRLVLLGRNLESRDSRVRRRAAHMLGEFGRPAIKVAARRLDSRKPEVAEAAIRVLGTIGTPRAKRVLHDHMCPVYARAQLNLKALFVLRKMMEKSGQSSPVARALEIWLIDSNESILRRALVVKSVLGSRRDINLLKWLARAPEPRVRSNAVEALTNLPTGDFIRPLLPLLETDYELGTDRSRDPMSPQQGPFDPAVTLRKAAEADPWLRILTERLLHEEENNHGAKNKARTGDDAMLDLILFLKSVPLFRAMSLKDVARVANTAKPATYASGATIVKAGERVTNILVLRSGIVELCVAGVVVEVLHRGHTFGETAILGNPHSPNLARSAIAAELLWLPVSIVGDLIVEYPDALNPLAADLARRISALHNDLAESRRRASVRGPRHTGAGDALLTR
jgi:hypothetical protein